MPSVYQTTCNRCAYSSELIWHTWDLYPTHEMARQLAWCEGCQQITAAEWIPSLEQIEALQAIPVVATAYDGAPKIWAASEIEAVLSYSRYPHRTNLYNFFTSRKRWDVRQAIVMKNVLELHRPWRQARISSARCLGCGGHRFQPLDADTQGDPLPSYTHPGCEGTLTLQVTGKVRTRRMLWTAEGERIGLG